MQQGSIVNIDVLQQKQAIVTEDDNMQQDQAVVAEDNNMQQDQAVVAEECVLDSGDTRAREVDSVQQEPDEDIT